MKTLDCLIATAVGTAVILLVIAFVFITASGIYKETPGGLWKLHINRISYRHITAQPTEEADCAVFGKEIIDGLKLDDARREAFFAELTEYMTSRLTIKVTRMEIYGDDSICIYSVPDLKKQNPSNTRLA